MGKIIERVRARARNKLLAEAIASVAELNRVTDLEWAREEALSWPSLRAERGEFNMPSEERVEPVRNRALKEQAESNSLHSFSYADWRF